MGLIPISFGAAFWKASTPVQCTAWSAEGQARASSRSASPGGRGPLSRLAPSSREYSDGCGDGQKTHGGSGVDGDLRGGSAEGAPPGSPGGVQDPKVFPPGVPNNASGEGAGGALPLRVGTLAADGPEGPRKRQWSHGARVPGSAGNQLLPGPLEELASAGASVSVNNPRPVSPCGCRRGICSGGTPAAWLTSSTSPCTSTRSSCPQGRVQTRLWLGMGRRTQGIPALGQVIHDGSDVRGTRSAPSSPVGAARACTAAPPPWPPAPPSRPRGWGPLPVTGGSPRPGCGADPPPPAPTRWKSGRRGRRPSPSRVWELPPPGTAPDRRAPTMVEAKPAPGSASGLRSRRGRGHGQTRVPGRRFPAVD